MILKEIKVQTKKPYSVYVGRDLISSCGANLRESGVMSPLAATAAVVTDSHVDPLYSGPLIASLQNAGFGTVKYVVPAGEKEKNTATYVGLLEFLAENCITRSDFLVALGGGVVGDLAGFAAATYLRGVSFVAVPTTLLAAVDSSVGGKTGVDLKAGKNLVGAFCQPKAVYSDLDTLRTLPEEIYRDGAAEVIKYALIGDEKLFRHLFSYGLSFDREYVISRSIEMKKDIVEQDEYDLSLRQLLNFGHTLAHAAELKSDFRLSHGRAVAAGMAHMARAAAHAGMLSEENLTKIEELISGFGLPRYFDYTTKELYEDMKKDKKRRGNCVTLIIPVDIGRAEIREFSLEEAFEFMKHGDPKR